MGPEWDSVSFCGVGVWGYGLSVGLSVGLWGWSGTLGPWGRSGAQSGVMGQCDSWGCSGAMGFQCVVMGQLRSSVVCLWGCPAMGQLWDGALMGQASHGAV